MLITALLVICPRVYKMAAGNPVKGLRAE